MITEDYVSFETAKLLKENGFDAYCHSHYYPYYEDDTMKNKNYGRYRGTVIKNKLCYEVYDRNGLMRDHYLCPTLQMTMKWLRKVHNIDVWVEWHNKRYKGNIHSEQRGDESLFYEDSYEQACETAIRYCLENLV